VLAPGWARVVGRSGWRSSESALRCCRRAKRGATSRCAGPTAALGELERTDAARVLEAARSTVGSTWTTVRASGSANKSSTAGASPARAVPGGLLPGAVDKLRERASDLSADSGTVAVPSGGDLDGTTPRCSIATSAVTP